MTVSLLCIGVCMCLLVWFCVFACLRVNGCACRVCVSLVLFDFVFVGVSVFSNVFFFFACVVMRY